MKLFKNFFFQISLQRISFKSLNSIAKKNFFFNNYQDWIFFAFRTKWKRQTSVSLELLAEANLANAHRIMNPYLNVYPDHQTTFTELFHRQTAGLIVPRPLLPSMYSYWEYKMFRFQCTVLESILCLICTFKWVTNMVLQSFIVIYFLMCL